LQTARTSTATYVHCPNCGERAGRVDHLFAAKTETRWVCGNCHCPYDVAVNGPDDIRVGINQTEPMAVPCVHVLVLRPRATPVFAVVRAHDYGRKSVPFANAEYFYNEHTCPTNWTPDIEMLVEDGDGDPHGLFEYVTSADIPADAGEDLEQAIAKLFPWLFDRDAAQPPKMISN
jgi:ribosomal protein S27AE